MDMRVTQNLSATTTRPELVAKRKAKPRRAEVYIYKTQKNNAKIVFFQVQLATQLANVDAAIARSKNPKYANIFFLPHK